MLGDLSRTETQTRSRESRGIPGAPPLAHRETPGGFALRPARPTTHKPVKQERFPLEPFHPARRLWEYGDAGVTKRQHCRPPVLSIKIIALGPVSRILFPPTSGVRSSF